MKLNLKANSMKERWKEQLYGAFAVIVGTYLTYIVWNSAVNNESYLSIGIAGPAFIIVGLALLIIPSYRLERIAKGEQPDQAQAVKMLTPKWWVVLGICLLSELLFYIALHSI